MFNKKYILSYIFIASNGLSLRSAMHRYVTNLPKVVILQLCIGCSVRQNNKIDADNSRTSFYAIFNIFERLQTLN